MASTLVQPRIRLARSAVGAEEAAALAGVIERGHLGIGSDVQEFEEALAAFFGGSSEVVCVNSGTAALHLALQACDIGRGDEVIVPTLTYVASFQAVSATGAMAIPCDVDPRTGCIDVADAARRITPRTRAIMPVHYCGAAGEIDAVYSLARKQGLRVIEDAAHAFGSTHNGVRAGAASDVACFSFDGIKNITCGEGGAIVTSDAEVAARVRDLRLLAVEKDSQRRYAGERSWEFDVSEQGWRYHMSNLNAAIGLVQLQRFETEFKPRRVQLAKRYLERLAGLRGVDCFDVAYDEVVPFMFVADIRDGRRDAVHAAMRAEGIETGIHYKPNHLLSLYGGGRERLPNAEALYAQILTLPLHPGLTTTDVDYVVQRLQAALSAVS